MKVAPGPVLLTSGYQSIIAKKRSSATLAVFSQRTSSFMITGERE